MLDFCYIYSGLAAPPGWTPYQWPAPKEMLAIGKNFAASVLMHHGLYETTRQYPPYIVPDYALPELRYAIAGARANGHTACLYTSWFYAAELGYTPTEYLNAVRVLRAATGCTGLYVDALTFPYHGRAWSEADNRYVARVLRRNIFGQGGTLILHATHPLGKGKFQPPDLEAERYFDLVGIGERSDHGNDGCPDWDDQEACKQYEAEQIEPRVEAGIPIAFLNRTWDVGYLVDVAGVSAIGHVGMKLAADGSTLYDNGTRTAYYQGIIKAREAVGV
jgi:hypothetical protein